MKGNLKEVKEVNTMKVPSITAANENQSVKYEIFRAEL